MHRLNILVLRCGDMEKSKGFYECFGMTFERHTHGNGPSHYASEDDASVFEIYPQATSAIGDLTGLGFDASDLSETAAKLVRQGSQPGPIKENPWGKTFVVRDPDGRRVEVKEVKSGPHRGPINFKRFAVRGADPT